jgi:L-lactate dehydrogenase complex protein LldG
MNPLGSSGSRARMLARLRDADARPATQGEQGEQAENLSRRIDAHYASMHAADDGDRDDAAGGSGLTPSFERALKAARAQVWRADSRSWPALLAERLREAGVRRLLLDPARAEGALLLRALPASIEGCSYTRPLEHWKSELFETVDAGFTVARSGIAATGTLVLAPDPGTPRTVSLVPPLHIALVHAQTLHRDLHAAMRAEQWHTAMPTNLVLVSGPSKTSDIQQTLAYGAHGPRQLWVVIVEDTEEPMQRGNP